MFETGKRPHITVVGDVILDRYLIGDATKLNPEQPGVVIRVDKEDDRLGGAAAVAMIAAGLGARVTLAGVLGRDEPGRRLQKLIADHDIEPHLWIDGRPTTWKQRIVARGQLRPDRCDREVTTPISDHAARFLSAVPLGDMLLISDYGKGVCTNLLLATIAGRAHSAGVPILVDPARSRNWLDYGHVTLIKANLLEALEAAHTHEAYPLALVRQLADEYHCDVVVTLGRRGMVCAKQLGATQYSPPAPTQVCDVTGAGDTVLASLGVAMLAGHPTPQACKMASVSAAYQVAKLGITRVPLVEPTLEAEATSRCAS
jgi:D-beta-D-heptose 7-phosphate kinase/D-beta-D-heptose 1-phosphate adenosyltransferase